MPKISLIVPLYNEAPSIERFLQAARRAVGPLEEKGFEFEFLFVNDGSSDNTLDLLIGAMERDSRLRVIDLSRNFGKEAALTAGLDEAAGDAVVPIDVDLQDPPEVIKELIAKWQDGFEVVLARRSDRSRDSMFKRQAAGWFYKVHNLMADTPIPGDVGDFRLLDRNVVEALRRLPERRRFMKGLFSWVGFRTATVSYMRQPRSIGRSKFSAWKLWNLAIEGITSFSTVPLKFWTYVGALTSVGSFLYMLFILIRTLIIGKDLPGYASLLMAILFLGGIQLIGIGVLGEYLGRVYLEVKQRPNYIVRRRYRSGDGVGT